MQSYLHNKRREYIPSLPPLFQGGVKDICALPGNIIPHSSPDIAKTFTHLDNHLMSFEKKAHNPTIQRIGLVFSGGQASGGHNVVCGLFDAMKKVHPQSELIGFLRGPDGIIMGKTRILDEECLKNYLNTGGFDLIGSGRTKIETDEQLAQSLITCQKEKLTALVVVGGDDSNTNAAIIAEYFSRKKANISVIGVPKTIDGDLRNEWVEMSFGFHTATKVYSHLISNIARDALSARKYWHFIRLMGRSASHIALECALATQPNICIISEEVAEKNQSLSDIVQSISSAVLERQQKGLSFGVVLLPEGLIEFIPEMKVLIQEINTLLAQNKKPDQVSHFLSKQSYNLFVSLPSTIASQFLLDRDSHGNVQVSHIETEKLIAQMVEKEIEAAGHSFSYLNHFFGYEGRAAFPSNFDADYCYSSGYTAFVLIANGITGYMASIHNLSQDSSQWEPYGIPLVSMLHYEQRAGKKKPVIKKALVDLEGGAFQLFFQKRSSWRNENAYRFCGPIQYFGPSEISNDIPLTLCYQKREDS